MTAREAAQKALSNITASPFARRLQEARLPSRVKHGTFILYETNADPMAHIQHYQQAMFMHDGDDAIMCKMFPSSLGKVALSWFHKLGPRSIQGWRQLAEEFTAWFLTSRRAPKMFESLSTMKQEESELTRDYAKKCWETFKEIESCSEEYAIATFKTSLPVRGELCWSLNFHSIVTLAKLMERIEQHTRIEDDILREDGKAVTQQPKIPTKKNQPYFKWPPSLGGDKDANRATNQHCSYHKDWGHVTEDCEMFKRHLDDLVSRGYLKEFI
ncbi:uncharacterized protein LOC131330182 [Rhododendron vialii]|uniref:uncharacterized protein LOC131330182 n=1 Tax=Rhododendron vialii TaxID=182163 RepID=UPI00265EC6C8|nr:uncharacterized protein LOC131330182 [Rhododendron vialii]